MQERQAEFVCGPDVTQRVLRVLKKIRDDFQNASASAQEAACDALVSTDKSDGMMLAEWAWDILDLFAGAGEFPSDKLKDGSPSHFENETQHRCCLPRYPCGPTVEFFGACFNMQVVNYTMWGITRNLCSKFWTINAQQSIAHYARNRSSPNKPEQDLMTSVGEKYAEDLPAVEGPIDELKSSMLSADVKRLKDEAASNPAKFPDLRALVTEGMKNSTSDYKKCETVCRERLPPYDFTYRWVGLTQPVKKDR